MGRFIALTEAYKNLSISEWNLIDFECLNSSHAASANEEPLGNEETPLAHTGQPKDSDEATNPSTSNSPPSSRLSLPPSPSSPNLMPMTRYDPGADSSVRVILREPSQHANPETEVTLRQSSRVAELRRKREAVSDKESPERKRPKLSEQRPIKKVTLKLPAKPKDDTPVQAQAMVEEEDMDLGDNNEMPSPCFEVELDQHVEVQFKDFDIINPSHLAFS